MPERLTPLEASLLALETARTPAQLVTVVRCTARPGSFVEDEVTALVRQRLAYALRYRRRVRRPAGALAGAIWADNDAFDLSYHLQRVVLPRPGTSEQLEELIDELVGRQLDRTRPLWAMYLIEGLNPAVMSGNTERGAEATFALVSVSHLALVDGGDTVELTQVLLDAAPELTAATAGPWQPDPEPAPLQLVGDTLVRAARDPEFAADRARATVTDVLGAAVSVGSGGDGVAQLVGELAEGALRRERPGHGPLTGEVSQGRRSALVSVPAADLRAVSRQHGVSVHDVVLAGVTGALRSWLLSRGASLGPGTVLTALTPMAVVDEGTEPSAVGCQAATRFQRLPVGEPDAVVRLWLLGHGTQTHRAAGRAVAADVLADLAGFAPATLHAIGLRAAADVGRPYDLVISNAPGPRQPHYLAGATVDASWAMLPLTAGHQLGVGVTSYAGRVAFTLVGAVDGPDLDVLADGLRGALDELIATSSSSGRAP